MSTVCVVVLCVKEAMSVVLLLIILIVKCRRVINVFPYCLQQYRAMCLHIPVLC